jgi:glucose/arabinose dehydrogenase
VIRWSLAGDATSAARVGTPVITGLPITSGRHGGCRLRFDATGHLHVGTGDAAVGTNPQDLNSLGGKTLRLNTDGTGPHVTTRSTCCRPGASMAGTLCPATPSPSR